MTSSEQQSKRADTLKDWPLPARIFIAILPILVAYGVYWYCESYESNCQEQTQNAHEAKPQTEKADKRTNAENISNQPNSKTSEQKAIYSNTSANCSIPCQIVKKALNDVVGFFTAFLVYVVYVQVLLMFSQEKWLRRSFKAARLAANAAKAQALTMEVTAKRELRAYVGVIEHEVIYTPDNELIGRVIFRNTGQTPAHDLTSWILEGLSVRKHPPESFFKKGDDEEKGGVLVPGVTWTRNIRIGLHNLNMSELEKESDAIWIWGGIDYKDSFGEKCSVSFRFWVAEKRLRIDPLGKSVEWWPLIPHKDGNKATYGDKTPS